MTVVDVLLMALVVMPFPTAFAAFYFVRLWRRDRHEAARRREPPTLLAALLAGLAIVALITGTWLGVATFANRVLGRPFPPEVLPVTLFMILAPLVVVCVSAFALWLSDQR